MNTFATTMIRMDHAQVMTLFQQYSPDAPVPLKQALVTTICVALDVHARLEEEIFYPALREAGVDVGVVDQSLPEHAAIHRCIEALREMRADDPEYDATFMKLMRTVIHHVAEEETTLLYDAERLLADRLGTIGAQMSWRRMELAAPHTPELAASALQAASAGPMLLMDVFADHGRERPAH